MWSELYISSDNKNLYFQEDDEPPRGEIEHHLRLTTVCLGRSPKEGERNLVEVTVKGDGRKITTAIAALRAGPVEMQHLDLVFGEPVQFTLAEGTGPVCLSGVQVSEMAEIEEEEEEGNEGPEDEMQGWEDMDEEKMMKKLSKKSLKGLKNLKRKMEEEKVHQQMNEPQKKKKKKGGMQEEEQKAPHPHPHPQQKKKKKGKGPGAK